MKSFFYFIASFLIFAGGCTSSEPIDIDSENLFKTVQIISHDSLEGRVGSPGNRYEPGKRPMSTMAPSMVFNQEGQLVLITGSPGGSYIPAAILRVISGVIDFDLNIGSATMLPRIHKDWPYKGLDYETTISADVISNLGVIGHNPEPNKTMGSTQSIHIVNDVRYGYADLRRPGAAVSAQ